MAHQGHGNMPPAGNYPPQPQYPGAPPPGSVPPQGYGAPAPVQQGQYPQQPFYGQPPAGQQYQQPPGQYPPQGQFQPQGQYPPQGHQQYQPQQYPPQQQGQPQQPGYGYPPQQQQQQQPGYGYPPQQQAPGASTPGGYNQGMPPQGQFPPQGFGAPMAPGMAPSGMAPAPGPKQPSPGYIPGQMSDLDATKHVDALRKAMDGWGTDEETLIMILTKADPLYMAKLNHAYSQRLGRNLEKDVKSETSGNFEDALVAFIRGPLMQDVYAVRNAVKGMGTNEAILTDVLVDRSNADLDAIKRAYRETFSKTLETDVLDDLSGRTKQLFTMILTNARQEDNPYAMLDQQAVNHDVKELYDALVKSSTTDILTVSRVVTSRSDSHLRAVISAYDRDNDPKLLRRIEKSASGHIEDAILAILRGVVDPHERDATLIEKAMFPDLKEDLLTERIVRLHWDANRKRQVMAAYQKKFKKNLVTTIKARLKGDYKKALVNALE